MLERIAIAGERSWEWFKQRAHGPHAFGWLIGFSFVEPIVSPIVPETLLVAILLAGSTRWKMYATVTAIASIMGAAVGYLIGAYLFEAVGSWLLAIQGLNDVFIKAQQLMHEHEFLTMIIASFTPLPDKAFVLAGGFLGVDFLPYIAGFTLGRTLRFFLVAYLVHRYGAAIIQSINRYSAYAALCGLVVLLVLVLEYFGIVNLF